MLVAEISVKFDMIPPGDEEITSEAPSGDKVSPSDDDGSPSGTEGRRKDAIALGTEGRRGSSGIDGKSGIDGREGSVGRSGSVGRLVGRFGIDGSWCVSSDSNSNVETISSASICHSRLEVTSKAQTSASSSPSE